MPRQRLRLKIGLALVTVVLALVLGEALVWIASPSEYLYPRYQFSSAYGLIPFPNVVMVHGVPRKFEYRYTINAYSSRGEPVQPGRARAPVVVVLGDSYAFGMGVSDGEEFPAVMRRVLSGRAEVVSLASPGWGLTQEVRRYYDLGAAYDPRVVILQFCANDPEDNLVNRVTRVRDGEFEFVESANSLNWIKKYLSRSLIQRSQLYNFFRTRASRALLGRLAKREAARLETAPPGGVARSEGPTGVESAYVELLETFARKLHAEGRELLVVSVDRQLDQFPFIRRSVTELAGSGVLRYVEVLDWLSGTPPYHSPEGHVWGASAHRVIGEHLAQIVRDDNSSRQAPPVPSP
jgi:hypothetical protein